MPGEETPGEVILGEEMLLLVMHGEEIPGEVIHGEEMDSLETPGEVIHGEEISDGTEPDQAEHGKYQLRDHSDTDQDSVMKPD